MKSAVRIAELKNHLSRYLRSAQKGHEIVIKDRETPIARLVPYDKPRERLESRPPIGSLKDLDKLPTYAPKNLTLEDLEEVIRENKKDWLDKVDEGLV
ncbi:MAG: type II toxin-antitoxin system prevent-host-death family antitoxin [Acidobacteria bacterium]|nr:type II toxin-antitoxin system prevent-host-death family antitoxin [Acidobacteriota bacterium]